MTPRAPRSRVLLASLRTALGVAVLVAASCGHGDGSYDGLASDQCRLDPEACDGGAGGLCEDDRDCERPLFCCDDDKNCGGGMCTAECRDDRDCPGGMLCEHDVCFYACDDDRDCAEDMTCEHGRTVCEYS